MGPSFAGNGRIRNCHPWPLVAQSRSSRSRDQPSNDFVAEQSMAAIPDPLLWTTQSSLRQPSRTYGDEALVWVSDRPHSRRFRGGDANVPNSSSAPTVHERRRSDLSECGDISRSSPTKPRGRPIEYERRTVLKRGSGMPHANADSCPTDVDGAWPTTAATFSLWRAQLALVIVASIVATIFWIGWLGWLLMRAASALF